MGYLHSHVSKTKCVVREEVMKLGAFLACPYICRWVFYQLGALEADNFELVNGHPGIVSIPFLKAQKEGIKYIFGQQDSLKFKHMRTWKTEI
jgi:hypothetical protein